MSKQKIMKNHLENIVFSINGYYVELLHGERGPLYHVLISYIYNLNYKLLLQF